MAGNPIVDQGVAGTGIESQGGVRSKPRHIGHTANVKDAERPIEVRRQSAVIKRRQRCALPAGSHVGLAEIGDDGAVQR